ncbi:putative ribose/galactose/methyl galactoside import ATP-binding protein [Spirochaetia bacterium]|nr:putative ribose/galactose/methyl galactoside import ATP-binding protein [Spirochaetia bacterium]
MIQDSGYLLEMKDVSKSFPGVQALNRVSLKVRPGKVHIICGENGAGKSTLMKVLNGAYAADSGEIIYNGKIFKPKDIHDAMRMGIAMIYQELNPVFGMTVGENVWLGREPKNGIFVDFKKLYADTALLLESLNIPYSPREPMGNLSIAGHQLIEIAKAISRDANVIIMDEPTSAIAYAEVEVLFARIELLKAKGVAILYITHKMDEIFRIADDITVLRDGALVETGPKEHFTPDTVVTLMVGREITTIFPKGEAFSAGDVVLEVTGLTQEPAQGGRFRDIQFDLRAGEILGFAGLVGAGRTELMRAVFGIDPYTSGTVTVNGKNMRIRNPSEAIDLGIAMISEDRKLYGLVMNRSARENISLVNIKKYVKNGFVRDRSIDGDAEAMRKLLDIKITGFNTVVNTLSGGNQQKLVLAKWLVGKVKILIMDEPTRGIDVGAKAEIHRLMGKFAREGMAIIMISSELSEIVGMSDRVAVMHEGRINGVLSGHEITQEAIMKLATKSSPAARRKELVQ